MIEDNELKNIISKMLENYDVVAIETMDLSKVGFMYEKTITIRFRPSREKYMKNATWSQYEEHMMCENICLACMGQGTEDSFSSENPSACKNCGGLGHT